MTLPVVIEGSDSSSPADFDAKHLKTHVYPASWYLFDRILSNTKLENLSFSTSPIDMRCVIQVQAIIINNALTRLN